MAISMGDPSGIGPEVILKALSSPETKAHCRSLIIGSPMVFAPLISSLRLPLVLKPVEKTADVDWSSDEIPVLAPDKLPSELPPPGRIDPLWSAAAMQCVQAGVRLTQAGTTDALVTAPINKEGIHRAGYRFQGHTDFLAHLTETDDYAMMLVGGKIRVVLATIHIPLSRVSDCLNTEGIARKIRLADTALLALQIAPRRIAVAGLNPHAGEEGILGREEKEIIGPAVEICRREGLMVEGPLPSDTLFYHLYRGRYDIAVVMYHDQGLIPLKMLAFDRGVNVTLGLPIIRTSPDHGTAYDIAGRGVADPGSMVEAISLAVRLVSAVR